MIKSEYYVIGCMSGTSLDGLDLTYIRFNIDTSWKFKIICADTIAYSKVWKSNLENLTASSKAELGPVDKEYSVLLASEINAFISRNKIGIIDAISSHGHTALHQPNIELTYQIGNLKELSRLTNNTVVCDFRIQDVQLGGQGAPLVPIGDRLLFPEYEYCLNLGGFANISFEEKNNRVAFDICPVNIVLNHYSNRIGLDYDAFGEIASTGEINQSLLSQLNNLHFYSKTHPKSLGLEWVKKNILPLIDSFELQVLDILRTFSEHIAFQISVILNNKSKSSVLVSGGGVYNTFLISLIKNKSSNNIIIPDNTILEYKEALIFGFLGVLKLRNETNCLASVTGAEKNHSSGVIYSVDK